MAEPSSCATLPKLKASLPFDPNRFGPIWSVPMHGATARMPRLIASCTTGAARSTSHVVKMMFACWPISLSAHAFEIAALSPCVLHVTICSGRPPTPPFAFTCATRSFAAASAGPSNGAIGPDFEPSYAQPMMIGDACADLVWAAAVAARATTAIAAPSRMSPIRELGRLICNSFDLCRRECDGRGNRDIGASGTRGQATAAASHTSANAFRALATSSAGGTSQSASG